MGCSVPAPAPAPLCAGLEISSQQERSRRRPRCSWRRFLLNQIFLLFFTLWTDVIGRAPPCAVAPSAAAAAAPFCLFLGFGAAPGSAQGWGGMETPWASSGMAKNPSGWIESLGIASHSPFPSGPSSPSLTSPLTAPQKALGGLACGPGRGRHPEPLRPPWHAVNCGPCARWGGHLQNESGAGWGGKPRPGQCGVCGEESPGQASVGCVGPGLPQPQGEVGNPSPGSERRDRRGK